MNVYDFDGTIYTGDSTADFYRYCLKKYPSVLKTVPRMIFAFVLYILNIISKTKFKETMYRFLLCVPDIDRETELFWDAHMTNIKAYYYKTHREDDVVISASPQFLLEPVCRRLKIGNLIASRVDKYTGKYEGLNCRDTEKVRRLYEWRANAEINDFYSDSLADEPLAKLAKSAYIVKGGTLIRWEEYTPPRYKMFFSREFLTFVIVGVINTFAGSLFAFLYRSLIPDNINAFVPGSVLSYLLDAIAFVPGWITGNILSYFLNSVCTFRDYKFGIIKYFKFLLSNLPNLVIQTLTVFIISGTLHLPSLFAYGLAAIIGVPVTFVFVKLFAFAKK